MQNDNDELQVETLALQKSHKASGQRTGLWAGAGTGYISQYIGQKSVLAKKSAYLSFYSSFCPSAHGMTFLKNSDLNNNAGEGQYASSYGQGGGMGRRDENEYPVELTPGWRYIQRDLFTESVLLKHPNQLLNLTIQPNQILISPMPGS